MLKIVGTTGDKVEDEKILIDDDNKLTKYGIALIAIELSSIFICGILIHKIITKLTRKRKATVIKDSTIHVNIGKSL